MAYHLSNVSKDRHRIFQKLEEVPEQVNDLVTGGEEWVVVKLPPGDHLQPEEISRGRGPITGGALGAGVSTFAPEATRNDHDFGRRC